MKPILRNIYNLFVMFGIDPQKTFHSIRGLTNYFLYLESLLNQKYFGTEEFSIGKPYPCLNDRFTDSGLAEGHYFHKYLLEA